MWVIKLVRGKTVKLADKVFTASTLFSPEAPWCLADAWHLQLAQVLKWSDPPALLSYAALQIVLSYNHLKAYTLHEIMN